MKNLKTVISRFINIKFGLIGAFVMGGIVFMINIDHGWKLALTAGLKQWFYTFFLGGLIIRLLEYTLTMTKNYRYNMVFSVLLISALTSFLVYGVHSLKGTPEPFYSTIPTILMAPPGFAGLAIKFNNKS